MIQDISADNASCTEHLARARRTLTAHVAATARRYRRSLRGAACILACALCLPHIDTSELSAQEPPQKQVRPFLDVSLGLEVQPRNCPRCLPDRRAGGPAAQAVVGVTLGRGVGIGIAARAFQNLSFEYSQSSLYWLLIGQYTLPSWKNLSLNAGVGQARHEADTTPGARYSEAGAAVSGGVTLRLPAYSRFGLTTNLGVIKTVGGRGAFRPWAATLGFGLNVVAW